MNNIREFFEDIWYRLSDFFKNWIWPGYYINNIFWKRYDLIRLPQLNKWEYSDVVERMFLGVMNLVTFFVDNEKPEEHVLWYKDEEGNDVGHKYGEDPNEPIIFPEYKGMYIMDLIKIIYNWYNNDYKQETNECDYLLNFWYNYCCDKTIGPDGFVEKNLPTSLEFFNDKDINWEIMDKFLDGNRENIFIKDFIHNKHKEFEFKIECEKQKYLHLAIEVRNYLWT